MKNKNHQRAPTRLKVSAHKFNIEISRHGRPYIPRHQRLCLYCTSGEIDDEKQFLLKCNFHAEARHSLFHLIATYLIYLNKNKSMRLKSSRLSWRIRTLSFWLRLGNLFTKNSKGANRKYVIKTLRYYLQDIFINVIDMTLHCKSTFCAFMFYTVLSSYSSMCTAFLTLYMCIVCF